jgi:PAS domain-containing protein
MTQSRRLALAMVLLVAVTSCAVSAFAYYFLAEPAPRAAVPAIISAALAGGVVAAVFAIGLAAVSARFLLGPTTPAANAPEAATACEGKVQARAYQALADRERMAQAIVENALDAFVQTDGSCVILDWSPHAEALMGWTRAEALGRSVEELVFPEAQRPVHRQWVDRFLSEAPGDAAGGDTKRRCCTRTDTNSSPRCR